MASLALTCDVPFSYEAGCPAAFIQAINATNLNSTDCGAQQNYLRGEFCESNNGAAAGINALSYSKLAELVNEAITLVTTQPEITADTVMAPFFTALVGRLATVPVYTSANSPTSMVATYCGEFVTLGANGAPTAGYKSCTLSNFFPKLKASSFSLFQANFPTSNLQLQFLSELAGLNRGWLAYISADITQSAPDASGNYAANTYIDRINAYNSALAYYASQNGQCNLPTLSQLTSF